MMECVGVHSAADCVFVYIIYKWRKCFLFSGDLRQIDAHLRKVPLTAAGVKSHLEEEKPFMISTNAQEHLK